MHIQTLCVGSVGENTYILHNGTEAVLVDPGAERERIQAALGDLPCKHILLTHAHFDHIGAVAHFQRLGAKVYLHTLDARLLQNGGHLAALFGQPLDPFVPDVLVNEGDVLQLCGLSVRVLATPGHTDGSVCYAVDDVLFSGDTLFRLSVGRTDFPTGNHAKLQESLQRLFALPTDCKVLAGHGEPTTLSFEKKNNPYA